VIFAISQQHVGFARGEASVLVAALQLPDPMLPAQSSGQAPTERNAIMDKPEALDSTLHNSTETQANTRRDASLKLRLNKRVIRTLSGQQLGAVGGGVIGGSNNTCYHAVCHMN
jgi:hypothetical protein